MKCLPITSFIDKRSETDINLVGSEDEHKTVGLAWLFQIKLAKVKFNIELCTVFARIIPSELS